MCGIAGMVRLDGTAVDAAPLDAMLDVIRHRGPDDRGTWVDGDSALGHVRLSIIDTTPRGHQPMFSADDRGVLAYNGEVYNFRALREELERDGATFRGHGDAEVVLEALHRWGPLAAIPRFDGMFALAYRDLRDGSLWFASDRLGIKSLSFAEQNGTLIFCSEIKGLLAHPGITPRVDRGRLDYFLLYYRGETRASIFDGVRTLEPGTIERIRGGRRETTRYFDPLERIEIDRILAARGGTLPEAVAETEAVLKASVRLHLISDVPLATMCSGGVDSSLVTALAKVERPDLEAYVADLGGDGSEWRQAEAAGRHLGVPLHRVRVDRERFLRLWPEAAWHRDIPSTHPSDVPLLAVVRACRADGIKVLLTGEGADELFGGYDWYARTWRTWRKARIRSRFPWPLRAPWGRRWRYWRRVAHSGVPAAMESDLRRRMTAAVSPALEVRRERIADRLGAIEPPEDRAFFAHQLDDLTFHLGWILARHDRIAMGASIEVRVPFLENDVMDLALHLPHHAKLNRGRGKWALKALAERWLPRGVVHAKKKGFPVPRDHMRGSSALVRDGFVPELLRWTDDETTHIVQMAEADGHLAFHLTALEIWGRLFFHGESRDAVAERLLRL